MDGVRSIIERDSSYEAIKFKKKRSGDAGILVISESREEGRHQSYGRE